MYLNTTRVVVFLFTGVLMSNCWTSNDISPSQCRITSYNAPYGNETFAYSNGNLSSITDHLGGVTTFTYDQQGRVSARTYSNSSTTFTYTYTYDSDGRVISTNGQFPTSYAYSSSGQLIKQSNSDGSYWIFQYPDNITKNFSSTIYYDASGNILLTKTRQYDTKINPFYAVLYQYYSGQVDELQTPNNVTQMMNTSSGQTSGLNYSYTYNPKGYPVALDYGVGNANIEYENCPF